MKIIFHNQVKISRTTHYSDSYYDKSPLIPKPKIITEMFARICLASLSGQTTGS